ncbi:MAG: hypothetical protein CL946_07945 [Ectothiorhodospiraceae bacterium]|nr:hypothetical protein [Ectothiorhodospiraceae bacterium]
MTGGFTRSMDHAMRQIAFLTLITFVAATNLSISGQYGDQDELYKTNEVSEAYAKGTRSLDGRPGDKYWQNRTDYTINVAFEPSTRLLEGSSAITYTNNSPDTLKHLVFHLYQDKNKYGAARNKAIPKKGLTDGVQMQELAIDGNPVDLADQKLVQRMGTALILQLDEPIPPSSTTAVECRWSFELPSVADDRMGTYDESTFFIAYWYPKIAVYDDIYGWDVSSYDGEHEFYNEYGSFDVEITVPNNYGVWATGELVNANQVLQPAVLNRYTTGIAAGKVTNVIGAKDLDSPQYVQSSPVNAWRYGADNVPDFAFAVGKDKIWDITSVSLANDRVVAIHAVYDTSSATFKTVAEEAAASVKHFSERLPAVPFPYPQITVFNGSLGMEFPMIVNDGEFNNRVMDVYVHAHEIAHTYLPFMVGVNETMNAWLDEGFAYYAPIEIQRELSDFDHRIRAAKGYEKWAGSRYDYPLMIPSTASTGGNLQMLSYYKSSVAFEMLRDDLGDDQFTKCLQAFLRRWESKHPTPHDLFYTFNDVLDKNYNWFWSPWFFEFGVPDLSIDKVELKDGSGQIRVVRKGLKPVPIQLRLDLENGQHIDVREPASVWSSGAEYVDMSVNYSDKPQQITLGSKFIPDSDPSDNMWKAGS